VTQDLAGREFRMRANDGREFRVIINKGQEPRSLTRNDRVTVRGYFTSGLFIAQSLSITQNRPGWGNQTGSYPGSYPQGRPGYYPQGRPGYYPGTNGQVTFTGTVANIDSSTKLWVRAYNGTTYEVVTNNPISQAISEGDVVRVTGWGTSAALRATRVTLVQDIRR